MLNKELKLQFLRRKLYFKNNQISIVHISKLSNLQAIGVKF